MATMTMTSSLTSQAYEARPNSFNRILVIDDDHCSVTALENLLSSEGYQVEVAANHHLGLEMLRHRPPSVLIFNVRSSMMSGYEACRKIVQLAPGVPFIVVSPGSETVDRVILLELGADECLSTPFTPRELSARVRALMRRVARGSSRELNYVFDDVMVDFPSMEVTRCNEKVFLTAKEFKTLEFMTKHPYRVLSRDELLNEVWGYENYPCTRTVDNHILKLRQKLERVPAEPVHFLTVHGVGYKFIPRSQEAAAAF